MKILIADDQIHLSRMLEDLLRLWGYETKVVHDGLAALDALRAPNAPKMALLDWLMPGMDGIDICRELRKNSSLGYSYLLLMTGQTGQQQMLDGLEAGADDFLVKPVDAPELKARLGTGRRIIALQEQLQELATRDALTGLWNRGAILGILDRELARAQREGHPVGVILADLDHFKRINDTLGHLAGDRVLQHAAGRMRTVLRPYDMVGRYGGEEFLIVLPGCDGEVALNLADRLRQHVAFEPVEWESKQVALTMSLGVATAEGKARNANELLKAADEALYRAKESGRNRAMLGNLSIRKPHVVLQVPGQVPLKASEG